MALVTIIAGGDLLALALKGSKGSEEEGKGIPAMVGTLAQYGGLSAALLIVTMFLNGMILKSERDFSLAMIFYMVVLGLFAISFAIVLAVRQGERGPYMPSRRNLFWLYGLLAVVAVWSVTVISITPIRATIYHKMASSSEGRGRLDDSMVWYRKAIELSPNEDYHYLALGRVMFAKANTAQNDAGRKAILKDLSVVLEKAHKLNPLNPDHMANLGFVYANWASLEATPEERQAKFDRSDQFFLKATAAMPNKVMVWTNWARVHMGRKDYDGALKIIQNAMKIDNRWFDSYVLLGDMYSQQGKMDKALEAYEQATRRDGRAAAALAHAYQKAGRPKDALKAAEAAVKRDPNDLRIRNLLGLLYFNEGRFEDALKEGLFILEQQPNSIPGHKSVAMIYERLGKPEGAIPHLEEVAKLSVDPDRTVALKRIELLKEQNRRGARP
jgi:tetratricopeptide (TPR) repeat protein